MPRIQSARSSTDGTSGFYKTYGWKLGSFLVVAISGWLLPLLIAAAGKPDGKHAASSSSLASTHVHPVVIRKPNQPVIWLDTLDEKGQPLNAACNTCHSTKPANREAVLGAPMTLFHQGLIGKHGGLTCVSCHNEADSYNSLRLADGRRVEYSDVMTLCAQCHSSQYRDYQHGAHGGMNGHWDLTKGGRVRNNCIHCHDQHAPKFQAMQPSRGPNDRFLQGERHD